MSRSATLIRSRIAQVAMINTHESDEYLEKLAAYVAKLDAMFFTGKTPKHIDKCRYSYRILSYDNYKRTYVKSFPEGKLSDAIIFATKYFREKNHPIIDPKYRVNNNMFYDAPSKNTSIRVKNTKTGVIFDSIKEAAAVEGMSYSVLWNMLSGVQINKSDIIKYGIQTYKINS